MSTGEVISDHWPTHDDARAFMTKLRYAMQGIVDERPASAPVDLPDWATPENATIAAQAVIAAGGSRERAAQAYAGTIFGEGEPAAAIDAAHMERAFDDAFGQGPVYVYAGMPQPDHTETKDPLTKHSPLVRMAIVAADHGIDPQRLIFRVPEVTTGNKCETVLREGVALTQGEAGTFDGEAVQVPRKSYSYCGLNDFFYCAWVGFGGPLIKHERHASPHAYTGRFDTDNATHHAALSMLAAHFDSQGFDSAAQRLRDELTS